MFSSNSSREPRTTHDATVRTWVPFGRGDRTRPTRPYIDYDREIARLRLR